MAMFGARKSIFGQIPGMDMMQQVAQPAMGMQQQMPQSMPQPNKPGFFQRPGVKQGIGIIGDTLSILGGGQATYAPAMIRQKEQDAEIRARIQMAEQGRQQGREDFIWKSQYERDNPKPTSPYRWESNDGSLMEIGPDGQPRQVYKDPTKGPEYRQGPDGRFYPIDTATGPLPTFTADDWNKGQPLGGSVGNGTGGFR